MSAGRVAVASLIVLTAVLLVGEAIDGREDRGAAETDCEMFQFRPDAWRAEAKRTEAEEDAGVLRGDRALTMARGLVGCERVVGLRKDDVRALLGPPDERNGDAWWYYVGSEEILAIVFGESGRAAGAGIHTP